MPTIQRVAGFNRGLIAQTGIVPIGTRLLQDTYPLDIREIKEVISEATGVKKSVLRMTGVFQKADDKNQNGRIYTTPILAEAVEAIQKDLGNRSVLGEYDHPCVRTSDFRVLTVDGWKEFKDIKVGDKVWSRVNGKMVESRVNQIVDEEYDGPVYDILGRNINVGFTPGHRILLTKRYHTNEQLYATAEDIYLNRGKYSKSPLPRTAKWNGNELKTVIVPGIPAEKLSKSVNYYKNDITQDLVIDAKLFASFVGLYLAEGSLTGTTGIQINQKTESTKVLIKELLTKFPSELIWSENKTGYWLADLRLHEYLKPLGDKYSKYISKEIKQLSSECLEQLIYWFAIGDGRMLVGSRDSSYLSCKPELSSAVQVSGMVAKPQLDLGKYSRLSVFTVSKQLIQDLHECVIKTGRCARLSRVEPSDDYIFADHLIEAKSKSTLYQLHISRNQDIYLDPRFTTIEKIHHTGRIYCLSVDHHNFYMEYKGLSYWTGNSDAKIHLERVSHLITKVWMEGKFVYGEAEVIEGTDPGRNLAALLRHGVRVGISSRGVGDMEVVNEGTADEAYMVQGGYRFVTWDTVGEPSVQEAVMSVMESKEYGIMTRSRIRNLKPDIALVNEISEWLKGE